MRAKRKNASKVNDTNAKATPIEEYLTGIREEILEHQLYFRKKIHRHRIGRLVVLIAAVLVPVLANIHYVPRAVLGVLGAIAAVAEGAQQIYQPRQAAMNAMQAANALEGELNLYMTGVAPYEGAEAIAFPRLVLRAEAIRSGTAAAFHELWQPPSEQHAEQRQVTS